MSNFVERKEQFISGEKWVVPASDHSIELYTGMLSETHLLIAGCSGSGKSTVLRGILHQLLLRSPEECKFILIDPKRIDLKAYRRTPHCLAHCTGINETVVILNSLIKVMNDRFNYIDRHNLTEFDGSSIYVIVDEFADLMQQKPAEITEKICKLGRLGRAARIHLIIATQAPDRKTIPAVIYQNITASLALRCRSRHESAQIIGISGAEKLPRVGEGLYICPDNLEPERVRLPLIPATETQRIISAWETQYRDYKTA